MATAKEQLISMMNPQAARLIDQQLRDQQVAQRSQGAGMLSGVAQAYTGMGDLAARALGASPMGANEAGAIAAQQKEQQEQAKLEAMQKKLAGASNEQLATIIQNNAVANPKLAQAAKQVLATKQSTSSNPAAAFIKAVQLGINNGSISSESGIAAIEAEQKQAGSGSALLKYPLEKTDGKDDGKLSAGNEKRYNELLDETSRLRRMNTETGAITSLLDTIDPSSGAIAKVGKAIKTVFGTEDVESVLRTRIEAIRVAQAIGNLPPGIASDKDIELVLGGTLPSTANPEALKEWFGALDRLNNIAIEEQEAQLTHLDNNKSMKGYFTKRREYNLKRATELEAKRAKELEKTVKAEQARVEAKRAKVKALEEQKAIKNQSINVSAEVGNFQEFL